jgi:type I restriction enzyme S subunit
MEVKPGYKQTEVGVIPEEWEATAFRQICRVNQGLQVAIEDRIKFPTPTSKVYITIQFLNDRKTIEYINDYPPSACCSKDDVLMTRTGNTGIVVSGVEGVFHNNFFKINFDRRRLDRDFLVGFLSLSSTRKVILEKAGTSTIPDLNHGDFYSIYLSLPPLPEQRAIATALSDADALLAALDRLIAKQRDLKQAAMQQLLTGQTRLPGFKGEWVVKRLGDVGSTYGGLTGKTKADFGEGPARYITFMNVMSNVGIDCGTFEQVQVSPTESQNRAKKGDLFFNGSSETPEEVAMCSVLLDEVRDVYLNSFCFGFRFHDDAEADGLFLAYYLRSKEGRELMKSLAQGSTRYNLSKVALLKSPLRLPKLAEQTAIAAVLTDMDAALTALEHRRDKTHALKQGMMQELLTGRTRLI